MALFRIYLFGLELFFFSLFFVLCVCFFFFKQNTAYKLRISDWSSDVCSSDLPCLHRAPRIPPDVEGRACRMGVSGDLVIADHVLRRALAELALQLGVIVPGGDGAHDEVVGPVQYQNLAPPLCECGERSEERRAGDEG